MNYLISILICLGAGALGSLATMPEITGWYAGIHKPVWNPPNAVFGPVWTVLYVMMGIAAARVYKRKNTQNVKLPLTLFSIQLALNLAWSFIFFKYHLLGAAFAEIIVLWVMIGLTASAFFRVDRIAGWMMAPYFLWVSFASFLCASIWILN